MTLRLSIVVPTLNRRCMLVEALDSIRSQHAEDIETIVVDGGSTDGTVEVLKSRSDIRFTSSPDRGVYDAFNMGIAQARGDIVAILNSDDVYEPAAWQSIAEAFSRHTSAHAVCGTVSLVENGRVLRTFDRAVDKALTPRAALIGASVINGRFFRRASMLQVGDFDLGYRYVSDRDWLVRWYEAGLSTIAVPQPVYRYRQHHGSLTFNTDAPRDLAIRAELLRLARRWRNDPDASSETRRAALLLEGRALASLVPAAASDRGVSDAWRLLTDDGRTSLLASTATILRSGADWVWQRANRDHDADSSNR